MGIEHGPVGRCAHRLPVELHLLLRVPELQGAGALVGRGLLSVGQGDGGGQVYEALGQVGVGGLEAAGEVGRLETLRVGVLGERMGLGGVPLVVGRQDGAVRGAGVVHLVLWETQESNC